MGGGLCNLQAPRDPFTPPIQLRADTNTLTQINGNATFDNTAAVGGDRNTENHHTDPEHKHRRDMRTRTHIQRTCDAVAWRPGPTQHGFY